MKKSPTSKLKIRLVASDLDGTLLNSASAVPEAHTRIIERLQEAGIPFAPATGRIRSRLPQLVLQLPGLHYGVLCNGATVYDFEKEEEIYSDTLAPEAALAVLHLIRRFPFYCEFYSAGAGYTDKDRNQYFTEEFYSPVKRVEMLKARHVIDDLETFIQDHPIQKIFMPGTDEALRADFEAGIRELRRVQPTSSYVGNYEFNGEGVSKAKALHALCRKLGIAPGEVLVFGDAMNDRDMLEAFPHSVAMGNAPDELKALATYVTDSSDEAGVSSFIERFVEL